MQSGSMPMMSFAIPRRNRTRRGDRLVGRSIEVLEDRVLLADGISPAPGVHFLGSPGVALNNVTVATFTITDPSGSPGSMWKGKVDWGDGTLDRKISVTAGPNNTFEFLD